MINHETMVKWVEQTGNHELRVLVSKIGADSFNIDYDRHLIMDGYYSGKSVNLVLAKIKADQLFGFGSASLEYLERALRSGEKSAVECVLLFKQGLTNIFTHPNLDCAMLVRAFIKNILVREYEHAFDLVYNAMGDGCIVYDLSQEKKRAFIEFALANGIKFRDME